MKKFFELKRTKMIDDAAFRHKPITIGKGILCFVLVYIVANFLSGLVSAGVDTIYNVMRLKENGILDQYYSAMQSGDPALEEEMFNTLMSSIATPWWLVVVELFACVVVIGVVIFYCIKFEKRKITSLGLRKKGAVLECVLGLSIGAIMTALVIGFSYATRSISFTQSKSFTTVFFLLIPACFIASASEELLLRGYFMTSLARDTKPYVAISISALVHAVFYILSLDPIVIINAFLFGFLMGLYVFKRGSLWGAIMINFAWTYLTSVIFGSPFLDFSSCPSILDTVFKRFNFISGGSTFGYEAGLSFTLVLVVAIGILLLTKQKKSEISEFEVDYFA